MEFRILGPLQVIGDDGAEHEVRGAKARGVLGVLIVRANQVVSRDALVDALWEQQPPPSATTTLQTYVYQLRKSLGLDALRTRPSGYTLEVPDEMVDALRFERAVRAVLRTPDADAARTAVRLTEALGWWRGAALSDFDGAAWARADAVRLETLRLDATERLVDARLALGQHVAVASELDALVEKHPLRERLWAQLMLALYRSDRQADALRAYGRLRTELVEQLGIEPSREVSDLEAAILAHDRTLDVSRPAVTQPAAVSAPPAPAARRRRRRRARAWGVAAFMVTVAAAALVVSRIDAGSSTSESAPSGYRPHYRTGPCPDPIRAGDAAAQCGVLTVPEDRSRPRGRTIELGVYRFPSRAAHPGDDPVVQVGDDFRLAEPPSDTALRVRSDSIYLAGRGFFGSSPRLTCPEVDTATRAALARPLRDPTSTTAFVHAAARCRQDWIARGADLSAYSAAERAADVRDLAVALGIRHMNLLAGGTATIDAREIAGRYPSLVRSITLFNVVPPDQNRWNGAITNAQGALDRYAGECENDPACASKYPRLRRRLFAAIARSNRAPRVYLTGNRNSAAREPEQMLLDGDRSMLIALHALDEPDALPFLPAAVANPTSGQSIVDFGGTALLTPSDASWGALLSHVCIDEIGTVAPEGLRLEADAAPDFAFLADDPLLDACSAWKTTAAPAPAPGPAGTPTLVLQGDLDPFTSREWAERTARSFGRATVVVVPHLGRVAISSDPCVARMRADFLANPQAPIAEDACVRAIAPPHFAGT